MPSILLERERESGEIMKIKMLVRRKEKEMYQPNYYDTNFYAHVGWQQTSDDSVALNYLFSSSTLDLISKEISDALRGVDPEGRRIIVPNDKIANVLSSVYRNGTRTDIGGIYSTFTIPDIQSRNDLRNIINQTINIVVSSIKNEMEIIENNKKLSVWNSVLGDFNTQGLRFYPPIKLRSRHPQYMAFEMHY